MECPHIILCGSFSPVHKTSMTVQLLLVAKPFVRAICWHTQSFMKRVRPRRKWLTSFLAWLTVSTRPTFKLKTSSRRRFATWKHAPRYPFKNAWWRPPFAVHAFYSKVIAFFLLSFYERNLTFQDLKLVLWPCEQGPKIDNFSTQLSFKCMPRSRVSSTPQRWYLFFRQCAHRKNRVYLLLGASIRMAYHAQTTKTLRHSRSPWTAQNHTSQMYKYRRGRRGNQWQVPGKRAKR